jgi:hypothetical protein
VSRISELAYLLRIVAVLAIVVVSFTPLVLIVFLIFGAAFVSKEEVDVFTFDNSLRYVFGLGSAGCSIYALDQLRRLFSCYVREEIISDRTAGHIQNAGFGLFLSAILTITMAPAVWLLSMLFSEPVAYSSTNGFGLAEIGFLFAAGVLMSIGWAMSEAAKIADENKGFI